MKYLLKILVLALACLMIQGCATKYIEKQSEAASQNTYAVNDSLDKQRIDLAWHYSNEATKLIVPPKHRIPIEPIYAPLKTKTANGVRAVVNPTSGDRLIIVPEQYKVSQVVIVGSDEYNQLASDAKVAAQLKQEKIVREIQDKKDAAQAIVNAKSENALLNSYNAGQLKIAHLETHVWICYFLLLISWGAIVLFLLAKSGIFKLAFMAPLL